MRFCRGGVTLVNRKQVKFSLRYGTIRIFVSVEIAIKHSCNIFHWNRNGQGIATVGIMPRNRAKIPLKTFCDSVCCKYSQILISEDCVVHPKHIDWSISNVEGSKQSNSLTKYGYDNGNQFYVSRWMKKFLFMHFSYSCLQHWTFTVRLVSVELEVWNCIDWIFYV